MARLLRSTTTGAILPFNAVLATRVDIQELSPQEVAEYEKSLGKKPTKAKAKPKPEPVVESEPVVEAPVAAASAGVISDLAEDDVDAVLASIE